jgi:hypothetical protein
MKHAWDDEKWVQILVGDPKGEGTLGRPMRNWGYNIKTDVKKLDVRFRTGYKWLRIGPNGGIL